MTISMPKDVENMRDFVSYHLKLMKWKFSLQADLKVNFRVKVIFKNEIFQYHNRKLNFNQFWHGFYHWNCKCRGSKKFGILHTSIITYIITSSMSTKIQHKSHNVWERGAKMPKKPIFAPKMMGVIICVIIE